MFQLWRRFAVWIRSLLLAWFLKKPIQWSNKLGELFSIIIDTMKKTADPVNLDPVKPIPDYNITPQRPLRDFLRKLLGR